MAKTIRDRVEQRREVATELVTVMVDVLDEAERDQQPPADAILAQLLWHLADPEAETTDDEAIDLIVDATLLADKIGLHWRSGR